jgi:Flp pilus assembly pilin Flp
MRRKSKGQGQGLTEYILLVALIAIAAIAAVKYFGRTTSDSFKSAGDQIANQVNNSNKSASQDYASKVK